MTSASEEFKKNPPIERKARCKLGINFGNLNIINTEDIPPKSRVTTPYTELLRQISKGQALVLTEKEVSLETAAAAVRRLQRRVPEFKDYSVTRRTVDGEKRVYIIRK
jgi:hypothetical protein